MRHERIGRGLKKGEAACDDKQREEKGSITAGLCGWPEQKAATAEQEEPGDEAALVASATHQESSRQSQ